MVVFSAVGSNDYGSRIRLKCHESIIRKNFTLNNEQCSTWAELDSLGIQLVPRRSIMELPPPEFDQDSVIPFEDYKHFYDDLFFGFGMGFICLIGRTTMIRV